MTVQKRKPLRVSRELKDKWSINLVDYCRVYYNRDKIPEGQELTHLLPSRDEILAHAVEVEGYDSLDLYAAYGSPEREDWFDDAVSRLGIDRSLPTSGQIAKVICLWIVSTPTLFSELSDEELELAKAGWEDYRTCFSSIVDGVYFARHFETDELPFEWDELLGDLSSVYYDNTTFEEWYHKEVEVVENARKVLDQLCQ